MLRLQRAHLCNAISLKLEIFEVIEESSLRTEDAFKRPKLNSRTLWLLPAREEGGTHCRVPVARALVLRVDDGLRGAPRANLLSIILEFNSALSSELRILGNNKSDADNTPEKGISL